MALDIFSKFATDESLENEGTWREIGGDTELLIARAGNKQYSRLLTKLYERNRKVLDADDEKSSARAEEIMIEVLATTILLGWKNVSYKGEELPYTNANARKLLAIKDFRKMVVALSEEMDAFKAKEEKEQGEA